MRVCVIGSGTRFLSGITVYTFRLANALSFRHRVSAVLMRQLVPRRFYPGRQRVGTTLDRLRFRPPVARFDGVDWFWIPSLFRALAFLVRQRPESVIFQWWTGSVFHSYLALALLARLLRARLVFEFHEVLDTGEARMPLARGYVRVMAPLLLRLADGFAFHTQADRAVVERRHQLRGRPTAVLPHGPHDHYQDSESGRVHREAPDSACNILYFGVIRPYKGLEDLIAAFDAIPDDEIDGYWLTVVGETWEGWELPGKLIARSRHRERITFVNRYVHDDEVAGFFAGADAVALPYHRSAISGPLHVAMGYGLPVVVTRVGGLIETVEGYGGAILVPPQEPEALRGALRELLALRGQRFTHPQSWIGTVDRYEELFRALGVRQAAEIGRRSTRRALPGRRSAA